MYLYKFNACNPEYVQFTLDLTSPKLYSALEFQDIVESVLVKFYKLCKEKDVSYPSVGAFNTYYLEIMELFCAVGFSRAPRIFETGYTIEPYFNFDEIKNPELKRLVSASL
jgi:hypothetical protein